VRGDTLFLEEVSTEEESSIRQERPKEASVEVEILRARRLYEHEYSIKGDATIPAIILVVEVFVCEEWEVIVEIVLCWWQGSGWSENKGGVRDRHRV
jgi:hypothetical protein